MPKRARVEEVDELHKSEKKSSRKSLSKKLEPVTAPCILNGVKEGHELLLLRYPASLDLSQLDGTEIPSHLLTEGIGGSVSIAGAQGDMRLAVAPRASCVQELFVAVVQRSSEEGALEDVSASVEFLSSPAAMALDISIVPVVENVPGIKRVKLAPRKLSPRKIHLSATK